MNKLTKDQRYYQSKKQDAKRDLLKTHPESPTTGVKVSRVSLCVRISSEASERLLALARDEKLYQWEMLDRIILKSIARIAEVDTRKYKTLKDFDTSSRYDWNKELLDAVAEGKKYKGSKGTKQLNLRISSTAFKTLQCCSNDIKQSKARIIQNLICNYKPTPLHVRQKQKERREEINEYYSQSNSNFNLLE